MAATAQPAQTDVTPVDARHTGPVTVAITQHLKAGKERAFEQWLQDVGQAAGHFPGHQGLTVLSPSKAERRYTYLFRFDSYAHLQAWEHSPQKAQWVAQLGDLLEAAPDKQIVTGLEYWFQLPNDAATVPPPRYKMVLVTILAIYPLSLVVTTLLKPLTRALPFLLGSLLVSTVLVLTMTYALMPVMARLFARWLFHKRT
jgi:antibiotic biosynthesis monooxygenase (ABM) superfamily enzyme